MLVVIAIDYMFLQELDRLITCDKVRVDENKVVVIG